MSVPLSVVLPVHNGGEHLSIAVESVLGQTFDDFELIIVDDSSTDGSPEVVRELTGADPRVRVLGLDHNVGVAAALNHGIAHANAPLLARMDADDISRPHRFELQVEAMAAEPKLGVLGTRTTFIDDDGNPAPQADWVQPQTHAEVAWHLLFGCPITHPSVVMRTDVVRSVGGYDPAFPNEDFELWTRLAFVTRLRNLDEVLLDYRMPAARHKRKLEAWAPHIERVGQRYAERLLGHPIDTGLFHTTHLIRRHAELPRGSSEVDVAVISDLLTALSRALVDREVVDAADADGLRHLLVHELDRLAGASVTHRVG